MPGAAPIGTTLGLQNLLNLELIVNKVNVPVIVDAGLGVPSEAARCMELGAAGVLVNTARAPRPNPPPKGRGCAARSVDRPPPDYDRPRPPPRKARRPR